MKKIFGIIACLSMLGAGAQETVLPAKAYDGLLFIKNGTVHIGNGQVMENATIKVSKGKIEQVGQNIAIPAGDVKVFDAAGKHVYPGLILPASGLGLTEIGSGVRGSNDIREIGDANASIRAIGAYNADSKITNTLRSNGILLAHIVPQGSYVGGLSSIVKLDGWTNEEAAYVTDMGVQVYMPSMMRRGGGGRFARFMQQEGGNSDPIQRALDQVEELKQFFREAKAWNSAKAHEETNLKYAAVQPLFEKKQKLFMHATQVNQMLVAIDFVKEFGFDVVIVGGTESPRIADLLKQNNISVILNQMHNLPTADDDDIDDPFKAPALLQKAGVLYCINDDDPQNRGRNLPFNAGTAVAYGLQKEEALSAITLNAAKILGIADKTGSIEVGKDANIIVSEGDILDMRSSKVNNAFIMGATLDLTDKHKLLFERYKARYAIK